MIPSVDGGRRTDLGASADIPRVGTDRLFGKDGKPATPFDKKLWFSDTYVRTADGWKYAFGQASLPLPADDAKR